MILVSGSIAYDMIMYYPGTFAEHIMPEHLPTLSMGFGIDTMQKLPWGTAQNIAYGLGKLGHRDHSIMLSAVGYDFVQSYPDSINYQYTTLVQDMMTATAFIFTDKDNNQITPFYAGAMSKSMHIDIQSILDKHPITYAIISPNDTSTMIAHLEICNKNCITTIFDPGQCMHFLTHAQLMTAASLADIMICNDYERSLRQQKTWLDAGDSWYNAHTIIVTRGGQWVTRRTKTDNTRSSQDALQIDAIIDPTGAGDALRSGLLYWLDTGLSLADSIQIGQQQAILAIQHQWGCGW